MEIILEAAATEVLEPQCLDIGYGCLDTSSVW